MTRDPVPQASPGATVAERRAEYWAAAERVLDSGTYILGSEVEAFESEFARYLGAEFCVGVASGTDAIEIALRAVGVAPGDGVITVSLTAGATIAAILRLGAVPIVVDVDSASYTIDVAAVERLARDSAGDVRLRAIVPVHLYGGMADMPSLVDLARRYDLRIVEDCAQAHGASIDGVRAGLWGDAAAFSFYPTKNLAALGDGGAVVTRSAELADTVARIREYGWRQRQIAESPGVNSRLDELQAAILRVGLSHLEEDNRRRRAVADRYDAGLDGAGVTLPARPERGVHVFHQYAVRTNGRDDFRDWCRDHGVSTAVHYPVPVHLQPGFAGAVRIHGNLDVTERLATEVASLPMFPQLAPEQVERVIEAACSWPGRTR